jgi:hypothetical protein
MLLHTFGWQPLALGIAILASASPVLGANIDAWETFTYDFGKWVSAADLDWLQPRYGDCSLVLQMVMSRMKI